ncbi:MAG: alpha-amylase C-terminal beta-sheet domain-containing protein [Bacteroidota bacterium]
MKAKIVLLFIASILLAETTYSQNYSQSTDVMLQGFNWVSHSNSSGWYNVVQSKAQELGDAQFDMVWLPPPSDAAAPQGYLPRELYDVSTNYGTQQELTNCISALHNEGIKVLADIVINHRVGTTNWADFTNPTWGCWAVVSNDEWGQNGGNPCGNFDTGDNYHAARDIDHTNGTVRSDLIGWMNWLKNTIGFDGWRYDYVRGFNGYYNGVYNDGTNPYFTVGELWDNLDLNNVNAHRQQIVDWIDDTQGKSAAFDFTTKGVLQAAVNNQYWRLNIGGGAPGVIGWWPSRAVTFIDNHDTGSTQAYWPFPGGKVMQGYAYILTHPGVPSVFWDHYFDWGLKGAIDALIEVRKDNGLHSESSIDIKEARWDLYAAEIDGKVAMKIGPGSWAPSGSGWVLRTSGNDYAVWDKAPAGDLTINFRPTSWSTPYLYFWNATPSGQTTGWPGVPMQAIGGGWYSYTLSNTDCTNFIISNNGWPQSPDMWTCNDAWIDQGNWGNYTLTAAPTGEFAGGNEQLSIGQPTMNASPNPIKTNAQLQIALPGDGQVQLSIHNVAGVQMTQLMQGELSGGYHQFDFATDDWPAGVYLAKMEYEAQVLTMKLIVLP